MEQGEEMVKKVKARRQLLCKYIQEQVVYTFTLGPQDAEVSKVWLEVKKFEPGGAQAWEHFEGVDCLSDHNRVSLILSEYMPEGRFSIAIYCIMKDGSRHKVSVLVQVQEEFLNKIV